MKSEINVTPLVDVVLVLLIIFMVVMPMVTTHGVQLPSTQQPSKATHAQNKTIYLTGANSLFYEEQPLSPEALDARLRELRIRQPETRILLHADRDLKYQQVMEVMSVISATGFSQIGLIAQPIKQQQFP